MEEEKDFMVHELGNASRSKKEVYDILTVKGGFYLPPIELANSDYISDILSDEKLVWIIFIRFVGCQVKGCHSKKSAEDKRIKNSGYYWFFKNKD